MHFARPRWLNSLKRQLLAAYVGGVLLSFGLLATGLGAFLYFQSNYLIQTGVAEYAESIGEELRFDAAGRPIAVGDSQAESWIYGGLNHEIAFRVLDDTGAVVLSSEEGAPPLAAEGKAVELRRHNFILKRDGVEMLVATEPVRHDGRTWFVQFASSTRLSAVLREYIGEPLLGRSVVVYGLVALLVYGAVMHYTLRIILKPLNDASALAARISPRTLDARLRIAGVPGELRPLVESFNAALDRLQHGYRVQQEFLASAAHELKTPLALIRAQIEAGVNESSRADLLQDVTRMGRQVQQLLHLAEASEPQNYLFEHVDAGSLAREAAKYLERLAQQQGVELQVLIEPETTLWRADRGALFTLLKNLLENAIQHSDAGAVVQLRVGLTTLTVRDEGTGVAPEDLPKLFTRFWRDARRRDVGAGLGLSICGEIAMAHGWQLRATRAEPGMIFSLEQGGDL
jgi:two-component system, OmpR family, sensor histidine kinase QseC